MRDCADRAWIVDLRCRVTYSTPCKTQDSAGGWARGILSVHYALTRFHVGDTVQQQQQQQQQQEANSLLLLLRLASKCPEEEQDGLRPDAFGSSGGQKSRSQNKT